MLIVADERDVIVITGMPAEYPINKRYRCRMCPNCRYNLLNGHSACVDKYYNVGEGINDRYRSEATRDEIDITE